MFFSKIHYTYFTMDKQKAGFQEIEHTADWMLKVWAGDLPGLFEQAARGMYSLSGTRLGSGERVERHLELDALDSEGLLVAFLEELLYFGEWDQLGFDGFQIAIQGNALRATVSGAPIISQEKEIKAVTFHNLNIQVVDNRLEVNIVFDV